MTTNAYFFVIYSNTSRNGAQGLKPRVMWVSRADIIGCANDELSRGGESLEDMAGVESVEDGDGNFKPAANCPPMKSSP